MKNIILLLILLNCFGCATKRIVRETEIKLSGQPSWFPLGGEIVHAEGLATAEESLLSFNTQSPRWFKSFPKAVSRQEYENWLKEKENNSDTQNERSSVFFIPSKLPYPTNPESILQKDQGATLQFQVSNSVNVGELIFNLTLVAKERPIIREVEHRFTNILPFLFAFYIDGKAITRENKNFGYETGSISFIELVPINQKKEWNLRIDKKSLEELVGQEGKDLEIIVLFSERQHLVYFEDSKEKFEDTKPFKGQAPQIIIRSNLINLKRTTDGWAIRK
jgi:hypothetical protein